MAVEQHSRPELIFGSGALPKGRGHGRGGLVVEVLGLYARVRWLVVRRGPVEAVSVLRRGLDEHVSAEPDGLRVLRGLLFGRAVMRVLGLLPTDSSCLLRSLVLTGLLARRGVHAKVVIGVNPAPSFSAHAWVEVDGEPVLPRDESTDHRLAEI